MADNVRPTHPPALVVDAANPRTPGVPINERRDVPRRLELPEREPDEIQIHIGRIEVVAVPPAPARAEAKPPHKSLNLDDYLKRRGESR